MNEYISRKEAIQALKALPTESVLIKWVPVSKKLPPIGESVLTTDKNGVVGEQVLEMSRYGKMLWTDPMNEYEYEFESVLAWCPMPDPWKGWKDD